MTFPHDMITHIHIALQLCFAVDAAWAAQAFKSAFLYVGMLGAFASLLLSINSMWVWWKIQDFQHRKQQRRSSGLGSSWDTGWIAACFQCLSKKVCESCQIHI